MSLLFTSTAAVLISIGLLYRLYHRLLLSRAKHRSLRGHSKLSRRLARLVPFYEYDAAEVFATDGADGTLAARRRSAFYRLAEQLSTRAPATIEATAALAPSVSDLQFTGAYRVPFQYRSVVQQHLKGGTFLAESDGVRVRDLDGNWYYDLFGSYGVNLLGNDFYKESIASAAEIAGDLGPVLGPYHPIVADNVERLQRVSGLDEVSFHMSGTEAVMQAVALARYHTRRPRAVVFCGAYHGWWDGVQPGVGNQRSVNDVYTLKEMSEDTLTVLRTRHDIACVLVNPLQALHPNAGASSDGLLISSDRSGGFDRAAYSAWLTELRAVCSERNIVLIFDEVFVGFRLGLGGAQAYFGVAADMVTYGKTLGGGLPVGALAGRAALMKRYRDDRPTDICFARGTFNAHPYVMAAMNEFLKHAMRPEQIAAANHAESVWNARATAMNAALEAEDLPIRVVNLSSIWMVTYSSPGRYNWMLQYYLRAEGLYLSWVGTGRFIFSHNYTDADFAEVRDRILRAGRTMQADGWWTVPAELSNKRIKRQVLRELLATRFGTRRPAIEAPLPAEEARI
ncbi:MAG: aminotransferase class III-fold pyridoxal phosphate-dependent enzyme [Pseudomonadota bacterium]